MSSEQNSRRSMVYDRIQQFDASKTPENLSEIEDQVLAWGEKRQQNLVKDRINIFNSNTDKIEMKKNNQKSAASTSQPKNDNYSSFKKIDKTTKKIRTNSEASINLRTDYNSQKNIDNELEIKNQKYVGSACLYENSINDSNFQRKINTHENKRVKSLSESNTSKSDDYGFDDFDKKIDLKKFDDVYGLNDFDASEEQYFVEAYNDPGNELIVTHLQISRKNRTSSISKNNFQVEIEIVINEDDYNEHENHPNDKIEYVGTEGLMNNTAEEDHLDKMLNNIDTMEISETKETFGEDCTNYKQKMEERIATLSNNIADMKKKLHDFKTRHTIDFSQEKNKKYEIINNKIAYLTSNLDDLKMNLSKEVSFESDDKSYENVEIEPIPWNINFEDLNLSFEDTNQENFQPFQQEVVDNNDDTTDCQKKITSSKKTKSIKNKFSLEKNNNHDDVEKEFNMQSSESVFDSKHKRDINAKKPIFRTKSDGIVNELSSINSLVEQHSRSSKSDSIISRVSSVNGTKVMVSGNATESIGPIQNVKIAKKRTFNTNIVKRNESLQSIDDYLMQYALHENFSQNSNNESYLKEASESKKDKIFFIIRELIDTERQYCKGLQKVVEDYMNYFKNYNELPISLVGKACYIFGNIEQIYNRSLELLDAISLCGEDFNRIAQVFLESNALFDLYPQYSKNKPTADMYLKEFGNVIRERRSELDDRLDLNSYLLTPIQRLGKYKLMFESLQKELMKQEKNSLNIDLVIEKIKSIMRKGNDFIAIDSIKKCPFGLSEKGSFIYRTEFLLLKPKKLEVMVFLFEGVIVFTTFSSNIEEFNYYYHIFMTDLCIKIEEESEVTFELWKYYKGKKKTNILTLEAKNQKTKKLWIDMINEKLIKQFEHVKQTQLERNEQEGKRYSRVAITAINASTSTSLIETPQEHQEDQNATRNSRRPTKIEKDSTTKKVRKVIRSHSSSASFHEQSRSKFYISEEDPKPDETL